VRRTLINSGVNRKPSGRILSAFWAGLAILAGGASMAQAAPASPAVVSVGNNTYNITRAANTIFNRDIKKLKAQVMDDAARFCASQGKQLKVLSIAEDPSIFMLGFINVKIAFKALDAGDPELTAPIEVERKEVPRDALYIELINLDDLHKKGVLTDEEFTAQKKKILDRSN